MDKANKEYILCVDCDGTLIKTDLLHEAILILLKKNPCNLFFMVLWLLRGKSYFKTKIAAYVTFSWDILPYNESVLEIITHAVSEGVKVVLATASPERWAVELSQHLGFFDEVFFTTEYSNCSGDIKGQLLFEKYGRQGFIYAGNSYTDLPVWEYANEGIIVSGDSKLIKKVETVTKILRRIETKRAGFRQYLKAIRIHQWLKNILIFIPAIAAHQYLDIATLKSAVVAFFAFSFCASAGYIINDFFDLESDRRHPNKKKRVFASAAIPIWTGVGMAVFLLGLAVVLSFWVGLYFFLIILCYFILTSLYSFWLKKQVVVDVVLLAGLYTIRIIAGAVAKQLLRKYNVSIDAYTVRVGECCTAKRDYDFAATNFLRFTDKELYSDVIKLIDQVADDGDSIGGVVEIKATNVPPGLGSPVFDKLDADIAKSMMSIGSVKGVEIGAGFGSASLRGSQNNDQMNESGFISNNSGGILGGISTGTDIIVRIAVKPTPSISLPQKTINLNKKEITISVEGRHDVIIVPRILPVAESMLAIVILDHILLHNAHSIA